MALWFFNKVVWFVSAAMLEGILLPSNMVAKTTFCLNLVKRLILTLRCAVNVTTSSFQHFPWNLVRVWKTKSLSFCLRYDPLIVFRRQNHIIFIFIKTMSHDLLVQMAYLRLPSMLSSRGILLPRVPLLSSSGPLPPITSLARQLNL